MSPKREYGLTVAALAAGALLTLLAAGRGWASVAVESALTARVLEPIGRDLAPLVGGGSLLAVAGVAGVLATRRLGRTVVGGLLAVSGAAMLGQAGLVLRDLHARAADWVAASGEAEPSTVGEVAATPWPWLAVAGAGLVALTGVVIAVRGRRWPAMGSRYERRPAVPDPGGPAAGSAREVWDALDRGDDPTTGSHPPGHHPPGHTDD